MLNSLKKIFFVYVFVYFFAFIFVYQIEAEYRVNSSEISHPLGGIVDILEDPSGNLDLTAVIQKYESGKFQKSEDVVPNYGFTDSTYWTHFQIYNQTQNREWILQVAYPMLDYVDLYCSGGDRTGKWVAKKTGDRLPFKEREIEHRTFLFLLNIPFGERMECFFRFQSEGTQEFPINLLSHEVLRKTEQSSYFITGMYYGFICILLVYNLILFFVIRDRSYIYYLLYIAGYGFIQLSLNGMAYEYFWPNSPWWGNKSFIFLIGWTFFWALHFTRSFLHTREYSPLMHRLILFIMLGMCNLMIFSLVVPYSWNIKFSSLLVILFSASVLTVSFSCIKKGYKPAFYFLYAWAILLLSVTLYALKGVGFLPSNVLTENGLWVGSVVEMSLLSIGLAERIKHANTEKEIAEKIANENHRLKERADLQSQRLEIELLKKNIQPHFLLNSINATLVWLEEDPRNAAKLLESLADELRMLLDYSSKKYITLNEELELCRTHLQVMSLRHDKKFELKIAGLIDGNVLIPPLVLHTLVENGLTHGFKDQETGTFLFSVENRSGGDNRCDGKIFYTIENNGSSEIKPSGREGLGMQYVKTRLQESYPNRWKFVSQPILNGWQSVIEIELESMEAGT